MGDLTGGVLPELADVSAELGADSAERCIDAAGQFAHAGGCAKRDQSDDQGVFDEILSLFTAGQILELHIELQKQVVH
jgi:hypothetical protein